MGDMTVDALEASFEGEAVAGVVARPLLAGAREPGGAGFDSFLRSGASVFRTSEALNGKQKLGRDFVESYVACLHAP